MQRIRDLWQRQETRFGAFAIVAAIILVVLCVFARPAPTKVTYKVKTNDIVRTVAATHHVSEQAIWACSKDMLAANVAKRCANPRNTHGYYCNKGLQLAGENPVEINTIKAGDELCWYESDVDTATPAVAQR